jgi:D-beta-D-heptose 7-phosphate kinase/D-beta-D-heptose 1-phosphate adenosyltransferase
MKVLIIGDFCIDKFIYGSVDRLNPEAPTPVFVQRRLAQNWGMAGNVAAHFENLGIEYDFIHQKQSIIKTRYVDEKSNYILLRVDDDGSSTPPMFNIDFKQYDFVIISDYCKGFLSESHIDFIVKNANLAGKLVFLDTKKVLGKFSYNAWVKINEKEYEHNLNNNAQINYENTIITLGSKGAKYSGEIFGPGKHIEVRDSVGAGDTFHVFFSLYYHKTKNVGLAINQANHYAGIACSQKGVVSDFGLKYNEL